MYEVREKLTYRILVDVASGGTFNSEVECRHNSLDPDPKRRKLVSYDVKTIFSKYFAQVLL